MSTNLSTVRRLAEELQNSLRALPSSPRGVPVLRGGGKLSGDQKFLLETALDDFTRHCADCTPTGFSSVGLSAQPGFGRDAGAGYQLSSDEKTLLAKLRQDGFIKITDAEYAAQRARKSG